MLRQIYIFNTKVAKPDFLVSISYQCIYEF